VLRTVRSVARRIVTIDETTSALGPRLDQLGAELDAVQSSLSSVRKDLGTSRAEHVAVMAELAAVREAVSEFATRARREAEASSLELARSVHLGVRQDGLRGRGTSCSGSRSGPRCRFPRLDGEARLHAPVPCAFPTRCSTSSRKSPGPAEQPPARSPFTTSRGEVRMSEESDPAGVRRVLRAGREAAQVPLREMSRRLGVDHRYLWDIEHARKKPSPRVLRGYANELNLDLEGLETKSGIHRHTVRRTTSRPLTCIVDQEVMLTIGEDGRFRR
jgi:ribosome-binding protein aMBF1 (putative translation factor)